MKVREVAARWLLVSPNPSLSGSARPGCGLPSDQAGPWAGGGMVTQQRPLTPTARHSLLHPWSVRAVSPKGPRTVYDTQHLLSTDCMPGAVPGAGATRRMCLHLGRLRGISPQRQPREGPHPMPRTRTGGLQSEGQRAWAVGSTQGAEPGTGQPGDCGQIAQTLRTSVSPSVKWGC